MKSRPIEPSQPSNLGPTSRAMERSRSRAGGDLTAAGALQALNEALPKSPGDEDVARSWSCGVEVAGENIGNNLFEWENHRKTTGKWLFFSSSWDFMGFTLW